jgi:hypothetical protein
MIRLLLQPDLAGTTVFDVNPIGISSDLFAKNANSQTALLFYEHLFLKDCLPKTPHYLMGMSRVARRMKLSVAHEQWR